MRQEQTEPSSIPISGGADYRMPTSEIRTAWGNIACAADKLLLAKMMESIGNPPLHIALWNGDGIAGHGHIPEVRMLIRDRGALLKLAADPEFNFGEMYTAERIDVQGNLADFLETAYRNLPRYDQDKAGRFSFSGVRRNSITRARRNIRHHYDIGNDFYKLWLDKRMVYTCAYFSSQDMSLESAQLAKLDHVCRKLRLQPGEHVVEAGCGWGALALYMAAHCGVTVQAYNISSEQIAYARQRAHDMGLDGQVEFIEDDYRNIRGESDAFVSVGMLEHVGTDNYQELGAVMNRCLKENGRGLIHSIGLDYPRPMDAWTEQNIFPGACPPSLAQMMQLFEPFGFSVLDVENLRLHYAKTLEHWLQRYEENAARVEEMFDAAFVRTWRLYLAGSLAAFKSGNMQLFQVSFARTGMNQIPWTRQHLYTSQGETHGGM